MRREYEQSRKRWKTDSAGALAVIVLIHYPGPSTEGPVKVAWANDLKGLGYQRVVFLRGGNRMQVNGLPVLETPAASTILASR